MHHLLEDQCRYFCQAALALVVFPYIIPPELTIYEAAAEPRKLVIMIVFVGFLIPVMLFYNIYQYVVFRGKVTGGKYGE